MNRRHSAQKPNQQNLDWVFERNKQFLKRIGDDIYINESVKVVNDMIGQAAIAKVGK